MTYGIVACCATKRTSPCEAKDLYLSPLFRMSRQWIERQGVPWFILSAKYGLLEPSRIVEPYDLTLSHLTATQRMESVRQSATRDRNRIIRNAARFGRKFVPPGNARLSRRRSA
jgi:hypothetical protein